MGQGFLPPGFLRSLLDKLLFEMVSMRECKLKFNKMTMEKRFCSTADLQYRVSMFYMNQAIAQWARLVGHVTANLVTRAILGDSSAVYTMDRQKFTRIRPAPRQFNSAGQLLEFNEQDCLGRMFMLQHESLRKDKYVLHMRIFEKPKDDRIVVLSSGHLAIMKPTNKQYTFDTTFITSFDAISGKSISGNHIWLTIKGVTVTITLGTAEDALQFFKNLETCINEHKQETS